MIEVTSSRKKTCVRKSQVLKSEVINYCQTLIKKESITPNDAGCQLWLTEKLRNLGFNCTHIESEGVNNLVAVRGDTGPLLAFCGHTDVVPPGDLSQWYAPPFAGEIIGDEIIGRGVTDMKGGIAAMLSATERFINHQNSDNVRLMMLITSDEEGEAEHGSLKIVDYLKSINLIPDYCLIGEPSSRLFSGDHILMGRRGSISGEINVLGKLGHVAYPTMDNNAAHLAKQLMDRLLALNWGHGDENVPATTLQVTGLESSSYLDNLVPASCKIRFNVRYNNLFTQSVIISRIEEALFAAHDKFSITWSRPCEPYFTEPSSNPRDLINRVSDAVFSITGTFPTPCATGGTSDGRFFSQVCPQVIELGLPNGTIHQVNERTKIADLVSLEAIYFELLSSFNYSGVAP